MKMIDCTHTLSDTIPLWPGTQPFHCQHLLTHEEHNIVVDRFEFTAGFGTHIDAPYHFFPNGYSIEKLTQQQLTGPLCVISCKAPSDDYQLTRKDVETWEKKHGMLPQGAHVFINFGWHIRWPEVEYTNVDTSKIMHFPSLSEEVAHLFVERGIVVVGVDTLTPDFPATKTFPVHKILLSHAIIIVENLTSLNELPETGARSIIAPLKIKGAAEAPARVFALIL